MKAWETDGDDREAGNGLRTGGLRERKGTDRPPPSEDVWVKGTSKEQRDEISMRADPPVERNKSVHSFISVSFARCCTKKTIKASNLTHASTLYIYI